MSEDLLLLLLLFLLLKREILISLTYLKKFPDRLILIKTKQNWKLIFLNQVKPINKVFNVLNTREDKVLKPSRLWELIMYIYERVEPLSNLSCCESPKSLINPYNQPPELAPKNYIIHRFQKCIDTWRQNCKFGRHNAVCVNKRRENSNIFHPLFGLDSHSMLLSESFCKNDSLSHCCFTHIFDDAIFGRQP